MSVTSLLNKVEDITKRPDARSRALLSLNTIIATLLTKADYGEELIEVFVDNPNPSYNYSTISLLLPNLPAVRKIEYVVANGVPIRSIKPRNALTSKGCIEPNTFYKSGNNLVMNCSQAFTRIQLGYYPPSPILTEEEGSTHWLVETEELMLTQGVIARIFAATGDDNSAQYYEGIFNAMHRQFRTNRGDSEEL